MPPTAPSEGKKEKPAPKAVGVKTMDATFDRIRKARDDARASLKKLRKEYKKETGSLKVFHLTCCNFSVDVHGSGVFFSRCP